MGWDRHGGPFVERCVGSNIARQGADPHRSKGHNAKARNRGTVDCRSYAFTAFYDHGDNPLSRDKNGARESGFSLYSTLTYASPTRKSPCLFMRCTRFGFPLCGEDSP
jgi:hypothetical protein